MAWDWKNPLNIIPHGETKYTGFTKLKNEITRIYAEILNVQFGANGHKHTGTDEDGAKIGTDGLKDDYSLIPKCADIITKGPWVDVRAFGAKGDSSADDTLAIQTALNYVAAVGGGKVLIPTTGHDYLFSDTLTIGTGTTLVFEGGSYLKLTHYTSVGTLLFNKPGATDIVIINPLLDGNNINANGENGISAGGVGTMKVFGGHIKNCANNPDALQNGGKAFQVEAYAVDDFFADGTFIENCAVAVSCNKDFTNSGGVHAHFDNIRAYNCAQFSTISQTNGKDTTGQQHEVTCTNFMAKDCGSASGVLNFSRASNCYFSGRVINSSSIDSIIRGRHNRCKFDIDIISNVTAVINMNPCLPYIIDPDKCENNTYNLRMFGTYGYLLMSDTTGTTYTNSGMIGSRINALCVNDVATGLVEQHATTDYGQTTIMDIMNTAGKRIKNSILNVYNLTNTFAVAPVLTMEYHRFANHNAGINTTILDTDSALNVSANGLPYASRMYDTSNLYSIRYKPSQYAIIEAIDSTGVGSYLALKAGTAGFDLYAGTTVGMQIRPTTVAPGVDNTISLGTSGYRWSQLYAGTAAINTSDIREKQQIMSLDDVEKRVAVRLKALIKKFKFNDAVAEKGENARWHIGVIAQEVAEAFASEGLDATKYSLLCYDEWSEQQEIKDEEGNVIQPYRGAGNRYGIRYEELLSFVISAL